MERRGKRIRAKIQGQSRHKSDRDRHIHSLAVGKTQKKNKSQDTGPVKTQIRQGQTHTQLDRWKDAAKE